MKPVHISPSYFPDRGDTKACEAWEPIVLRRALDRRVLVVATARIEGSWKAYVAAVPGVNHSTEQQIVLDYGTEVDEAIARYLFPFFDGVPYAAKEAPMLWYLVDASPEVGPKSKVVCGGCFADSTVSARELDPPFSEPIVCEHCGIIGCVRCGGTDGITLNSDTCRECLSERS